MLPGPTLVRECPSCRGHVIETTMASGNTFGALFWPDGRMEAPMMPNYAAYVGCAHCKASFWIEDIKEVGQFSWGEKITNTFSDATEYKEPTEEIFLQGLKENDLTKNKEIYLRSNLMRLYNDINRDQKVQTPATEAQIDNWKRLLEILGNEPTADKLLKGEIYREMGEFDKAETTLKGEFDEDYLQSLDILDKLIKARDSRIMCINPSDD
jgi:hypothetical protein